MTSTSDALGASPSAGEVASQNSGAKDIRAVVEGLEKELRDRKRKRWIRWGVGLTLLAGASFAYISYKRAHAPPPEARFTSAEVEVRDVIEEVQSTGVVEPVNQVEVGAQVSGRVVTVDVDFNDEVKAGQKLAEIDPELFGAEVTQQNAQLSAAQAAVKSADARRTAVQTRVARLKLLVAEKVASLAELENAQGELDVATAEVGTAEAQIAQIRARLMSARTTLNYTKIFSPIDGVVIDRQVEPGQTVASSFNTPVLFVIAKDLQQMRVLAEIDEADVGKVKEGMTAQVTVDAFPRDSFAGTLTQIRLSPNNVEGVVTYSAVIVVENVGGKLRPGMTATATVITREAKGVVAVRNSALRFEPLKSEEKQGGSKSSEGSKSTKAEARAKLGAGQGRIYQAGDGPPEDPGTSEKLVQIGISDGVWTEIKEGLSKDQEVIVDEKPQDKKKGFRLF